MEGEDLERGVRATSEEVVIGMAGNHPVAISKFILVTGEFFSFGEIPDTDGVVLRIGYHDVLLFVKGRATDVIVVACEGVELPRLCICILPDFDLSVVRCGDYEGLRGVESAPVDLIFVSVHDADELNFGP